MCTCSRWNVAALSACTYNRLSVFIYPASRPENQSPADRQSHGNILSNSIGTKPWHWKGAGERRPAARWCNSRSHLVVPQVTVVTPSSPFRPYIRPRFVGRHHPGWPGRHPRGRGFRDHCVDRRYEDHRSRELGVFDAPSDPTRLGRVCSTVFLHSVVQMCGKPPSLQHPNTLSHLATFCFNATVTVVSQVFRLCPYSRHQRHRTHQTHQTH